MLNQTVHFKALCRHSSVSQIHNQRNCLGFFWWI